MAGIDCCEASPQGCSDHRDLLVGGRRIDVHSGGRVLCMKEDSLQPRYLALVRDGGQLLPLLCGDLRGDPASQSVNLLRSKSGIQIQAPDEIVH